MVMHCPPIVGPGGNDFLPTSPAGGGPVGQSAVLTGAAGALLLGDGAVTVVRGVDTAADLEGDGDAASSFRRPCSRDSEWSRRRCFLALPPGNTNPPIVGGW